MGVCYLGGGVGLGVGCWALWGCLGCGLWVSGGSRRVKMGQETSEIVEKSATYESTELT